MHFVGKNNVTEGLGSVEEDEAGGGHAHCGTMVYLGDNCPDRYRNSIFLNNIHGRRINNDILRRAGSGYIASHARDLMVSRDPWYMGVTLRYGPNGAVFASDWSDTGECHSMKNTRRHTGRIYKITYGKPAAANVDLTQLSDRELVKLQRHRNDWYVRHARRLLQERAADGRDMSEVHRQLRTLFSGQADVPLKLRALWALHVIGGLDDEFLIGQLNHQSEYVRAWAVRFLCEEQDPGEEALKRFRELASAGDSTFVRLHLASALQRLRPNRRWPLATSLLGRAEDVDDANLPLMIWYGIEPLVHDDVDRFVALVAATKIPLIRRHIARRVASLAAPHDGLNSLSHRLAGANEDGLELDLLTGILQGLEGRRSVLMPQSWPKAYAKLKQDPNLSVRERALQLALIFSDPIALRTLRKQAAEKTVSAASRNGAIKALVAKKADELAPLLLELVGDPATRRAALRGLAEYDHGATASTIVGQYNSLDVAARKDAIGTLASRPDWAMSLMDTVESKRISRTDLTAYTGRQLRNLGNDRLTAGVRKLWGEVRTTPAKKAKLISDYKQQLTPESLARADRSVGHAVFQKSCANCHRLFVTGGNIGPDITGSQRRNLDYVLETLIDPSAAVTKDFQMQILATRWNAPVFCTTPYESSGWVVCRCSAAGGSVRDFPKVPAPGGRRAHVSAKAAGV